MTEEADLKRDMRRYLTANHIFWSNVQGGPGSKQGDPDMILCYRGRYVGIEAKTPTGRQSPMQKIREKEIQESGGRYFVVTSLDSLVNALLRVDDDIRRGIL